jgi:hypothetical protein
VSERGVVEAAKKEEQEEAEIAMSNRNSPFTLLMEPT